MNDITHLLNAIEQGDLHAAGQLWPLVYDELRKMAAAQMTHEKPGQTLDATALVHEAYLRLAGDPDQAFANRRHFFAAAAQAMRRILVEIARRKGRDKYGGGRQRETASSTFSRAAPSAGRACEVGHQRGQGPVPPASTPPQKRTNPPGC